MKKKCYIADLNILRLLKDNYYPEIFKKLWHIVDDMILKGKLLIIEPVYVEITNGSDEDFLTKHLSDLKRNSGWKPAELPDGIEEVVKEILKKFKGRIAYHRNEADPYIVAYAILKNRGDTIFNYEYIVLTAEKYKPNGAKIPNMCEEFNIPYINLKEFLIDIGYTDS
ncbi:hypothetical protein JCM9492_11380 [Aquifex pyrophilus]